MIETFQDFLIQITLFDYIFFVLTIYFLIQGSRKGFVLSLLSAAKWVLAYILTIYFGVFTGIAMLLAMVSVLTLLPSLLLKIKPFN